MQISFVVPGQMIKLSPVFPSITYYLFHVQDVAELSKFSEDSRQLQ